MDSLLPLVSFVFVTSVTPGPNNLMLTASGIQFGFWRTLPHILGIQFGIAIQIILCAYGVGLFLLKVPEAFLILKLVGSIYLTYLAWALSKNLQQQTSFNSSERPFSFVQAALFQFVNPKAWLMAATAATLFLPKLDSQIVSVGLLCLIFNFVGAPSSGSWAIMGSVIKKHLLNPVWRRCFSWLVVGLVMYVAVAIWFY